MKKKQVMSRGKRAFWLVLKRVFAASAAAILAALAFNSVITVEINGHVYRRNIALERKDSGKFWRRSWTRSPGWRSS